MRRRSPDQRTLKKIASILKRFGYTLEMHTNEHGVCIEMAEDVTEEGPTCFLKVDVTVENDVRWVQITIELPIEEEDSETVSAIHDAFPSPWQFASVSSDSGSASYMLSICVGYLESYLQTNWLMGIHEMMCDARARACIAFQQLTYAVAETLISDEPAGTKEYVH